MLSFSAACAILLLILCVAPSMSLSYSWNPYNRTGTSLEIMRCCCHYYHRSIEGTFTQGVADKILGSGYYDTADYLNYKRYFIRATYAHLCHLGSKSCVNYNVKYYYRIVLTNGTATLVAHYGADWRCHSPDTWWGGGYIRDLGCECVRNPSGYSYMEFHPPINCVSCHDPGAAITFGYAINTTTYDGPHIPSYVKLGSIEHYNGNSSSGIDFRITLAIAILLSTILIVTLLASRKGVSRLGLILLLVAITGTIFIVEAGVNAPSLNYSWNPYVETNTSLDIMRCFCHYRNRTVAGHMWMNNLLWFPNGTAYIVRIDTATREGYKLWFHLADTLHHYVTSQNIAINGSAVDLGMPSFNETALGEAGVWCCHPPFNVSGTGVVTYNVTLPNGTPYTVILPIPYGSFPSASGHWGIPCLCPFLPFHPPINCSSCHDPGRRVLGEELTYEKRIGAVEKTAPTDYDEYLALIIATDLKLKPLGDEREWYGEVYCRGGGNWRGFMPVGGFIRVTSSGIVIPMWLSENLLWYEATDPPGVPRINLMQRRGRRGGGAPVWDTVILGGVKIIGWRIVHGGETVHTEVWYRGNRDVDVVSANFEVMFVPISTW